MIVVEAPAYVPYEPKTPELDALKAELQRQLKELAVGPGEILWAASQASCRAVPTWRTHSSTTSTGTAPSHAPERQQAAKG